MWGPPAKTAPALRSWPAPTALASDLAFTPGGVGVRKRLAGKVGCRSLGAGPNHGNVEELTATTPLLDETVAPQRQRQTAPRYSTKPFLDTRHERPTQPSPASRSRSPAQR